MARCSENTTSSAVSAEPSWNRTPWRNVKRICVRLISFQESASSGSIAKGLLLYESRLSYTGPGMPFCSALFCAWMSQVATSSWLDHLKGLACNAGAHSSAAANSEQRRRYLGCMARSRSKVLLCRKSGAIANGKSLHPGPIFQATMVPRKNRPRAVFPGALIFGRSEAVAQAEVVAVGVGIGCRRSASQGDGSATLVACAGERGVQGGALGQVVGVTHGQQVRARIHRACDIELVGRVRKVDFARAHRNRATGQHALAGAALGGLVLAVLGHQLDHGEVILATHVHGLDVARQVLGLRESQRSVDRAVLVAGAQSQAVAVLLVGTVAAVLTQVVHGLAVEAAQVAGQDVADRVRCADPGRAANAGDQHLVGANAVRAERIECGQVRELGGVVTTEANFT